jgi:hypothetical protein
MKNELKIDFKETQILKQLLQDSYNEGVISNTNNKIVFEEDTPNYLLCKGLHNLTVRLWNDELIDGPLRCIIQEEESYISLYPCSIHYEIDNNKYSFLN